jgi:transcriptional regulator with XRE-family HTH domain
MTEAIGPRMRRLRRERGMSLGGLADLCGIPKPRLSRYENGFILPSLRSVTRIATALGIDEATLIGRVDRGNRYAFADELGVLGIKFTSPQSARRYAEEISPLLRRALSKRRDTG